MGRRRIGVLLMVLGAAGLGAAVYGLARDVDFLAQPFYAHAWWSWILFLDGFCAFRRSGSLLTARIRLLFPIALWSVTFWIFFELLNVRFQNWYYVGVFREESAADLLRSALFTVACFATVFTGLFETCEALAAAGLFRSWRGPPGRIPPFVPFALQALGAAMALAAILFPYWLAPLIWGSFTFLVDPWNYRRGARSFLRDIEAGDLGAVARVFAAGLLAGIVWEGFNFFAPQKWIYTVHGLEGFKLFEMPLLGFVGFPALALDSMAAFSLLSWLLLGNAAWDPPEDLAYALAPRPRPSRLFRLAAVPLQIFFWAAVVDYAVPQSVSSLEVRLADLRLPGRERAALEALGIERPGQLSRGGRDPSGREAIRARLGLDDAAMEALLDRTDLYLFKGIGGQIGPWLESCGVRRVEDLRRWTPEALHRRLAEAAGRAGRAPPRLDIVRVWVLAARNGGGIVAAPP